MGGVFIPYSSDAPVYHRPWTTIGLVVVNVVVFALWVGGGIGDEAYETWWVLPHGSIDPVQWLTSAFAHADVWHLLGNMVFLWSFGLIAEGKLGWKIFLPLYLGLAIVPNIIEQVIMYAPGGSGSLGASTAISGLIALALLWAPKNEMDVAVVLGWFVKHFEVAVWVVALFFIGWDFLAAILVGFSLSTPVLHLLGVLVGAPVGYLFLKRGWVDCEGWDLLTIMRHGRPQSRVARVVADSLADERAEREAERREAQASAEALAAGYLAEGDLDAVLLVLEGAERQHGPWELGKATLRGLVQALWTTERYDEFEPWAARLADAYPADAVPIRLARAKLLIEQRNRPSTAMKELEAIEAGGGLDAAQRQQLARLTAKAQERIDDGVLEIMD